MRMETPAYFLPSVRWGKLGCSRVPDLWSLDNHGHRRVGPIPYRFSRCLRANTRHSFTSFTSFLLHNPSFEWIVSTPHLRVTALGTNFDGVNLSKNISLDGFNNLPGVTISDFDLMGSTSDSGIEFDTIALIPSPAGRVASVHRRSLQC